jgi:hypothetical protein
MAIRPPPFRQTFLVGAPRAVPVFLLSVQGGLAPFCRSLSPFLSDQRPKQSSLAPFSALGLVIEAQVSHYFHHNLAISFVVLLYLLH